MKSFIWRLLTLVCVLFVGVLIGMNKANEGMLEMKGYNDQSFQTPVEVNKTDNGEVETSLMGNELGTFNIDEKKEKLQEVKAFNFFSEIGKLLADTVSTITNGIVEFVSSLF
ncbi:MAG TPA: DUF3679 domain-containing protein [Bacillaceae bacterium]|nr:DUF3679 domain-containing protein [Paenibacillus bovis]HLU23233.1 DUF3679 domain-containing protein [Bacillaceae bacterium]